MSIYQYPEDSMDNRSDFQWHHETTRTHNTQDPLLWCGLEQKVDGTCQETSPIPNEHHFPKGLEMDSSLKRQHETVFRPCYVFSTKFVVNGYLPFYNDLLSTTTYFALNVLSNSRMLLDSSFVFE